VVAGHVLFSRLRIGTAAGGREAAALAPVAVLPAH
jgi:predicted N-acetyltransferase YhbS